MITVVPNTAELHWLSSDRDTLEWQTEVVRATIGTEGRELDTGKRFYLDGSRVWREWSDPHLLTLNKIAETLERVTTELAAINVNTGEVINETEESL